MSQLELDRMEILQRVINRRLPQTQAAGILGLTVRHTRRLVRVLEADGAAGLISKRRGKPSNYRLSDDLKLVVLDLIRAHYAELIGNILTFRTSRRGYDDFSGVMAAVSHRLREDRFPGA